MLWQMVAVVSLILLSAAYLGWQAFKTWTAKGGCGGGCACPGKKKLEGSPGLISEKDLTVRIRQRQS